MRWQFWCTFIGWLSLSKRVRNPRRRKNNNDRNRNKWDTEMHIWSENLLIHSILFFFTKNSFHQLLSLSCNQSQWGDFSTWNVFRLYFLYQKCWLLILLLRFVGVWRFRRCQKNVHFKRNAGTNNSIYAVTRMVRWSFGNWRYWHEFQHSRTIIKWLVWQITSQHSWARTT